ncbi:hypothetical protein ACLESO_23005 [Pyxidicoccus sp. 3LG]
MSRLAQSFVKVLALVVLCACGTETPSPTELCAEVDCGPGQCVTSSGQAACTCPEGYVSADVSCKRDIREGDDHGDTLAAATPVEPGPEGTANLDLETDQDLFSFHVTAGHHYRFHCMQTGLVSYRSACRVTLLGADGQALPGAKFNDTVSGYHSGMLATQDGTVYARVDRNPGGAFLGNEYTYSLVDLGPDDFANTSAEATRVPLGVTVTGQVEIIGDVDVFAVELIEGHAYRLSCDGGRSHCGMRVRGPQDEVLYQTQHGDIIKRADTFDLQGAQAGRHTVELFVAGGLMFSTGYGDYTFSAAELAP